MKRLRIPQVLAFTVLAASSIAGIAIACGGGQSPPTEAGPVIDVIESTCDAFCIPDGTDAGVCPEPAFCADGAGNCPAGCTPVG
jgi:hypothetical protein